MHLVESSSGDEESSPAADLTGQVTKTEEHCVNFGTFTEIFKGEWQSSVDKTNMIVAVKVLRGIHTQTDVLERVLHRLHRDTEAWARLDHPNVLPFLGLSMDLGPSPALISPFCRNGNARQYLKRNPCADRLLMMQGILLGLQHLHENDVIHGNFKTSDVLIGDSGEPLISNHGLSLSLLPAGLDAELCSATRYTPPELILSPSIPDNDKPTTKVSKMSDVYSSSMVSLEILTGLPPFHYFSNISFVIVTVAGGGKPDPYQYELSPLLDEFWPLLEACWDACPQERPTIDQLVHEIQAARAQHA